MVLVKKIISENVSSFNGEIFNVGTGVNYSIEEIYKKVSKILGIEKKIKIIPFPKDNDILKDDYKLSNEDVEKVMDVYEEN